MTGARLLALVAVSLAMWGVLILAVIGAFEVFGTPDFDLVGTLADEIKNVR